VKGDFGYHVQLTNEIISKRKAKGLKEKKTLIAKHPLRNLLTEE